MTLCILNVWSQESRKVAPKESIYRVKRLKEDIQIDANWNKSQWRSVKEIDIRNLMGKAPAFMPRAKAKMTYDEDNLYVIFKVYDRFIKVVADKINGPVWRDSAVEFFFSPDTADPLKYFNLEINAGGTPLLHFNSSSRGKHVEEQHIKEIEIAHSLPNIVDPEINGPQEWTIEYRVPIAMLKKYAQVSQPAKGVEWRANFYKIAENTSNVHFLTWSVVENDKPNFHLPQFFGVLKFR